ncbi:head-tail adaptor protein [Sphingomonas arantia]|uniref:Head-tail adaptor protein n=1 Tax=Sphingomonas arantia TaxID=1460676 RepID=A0ABW4TYX5_9SPHN
MLIDARHLDRQITFQRKVAATGFASAGTERWEDVATGVWAQVRELLPSRAEKVADGLSIANRPARIRLRWRDDITADMRILHGTRVMQIIAGPVELGRRDGIELMVEDYSTTGGSS